MTWPRLLSLRRYSFAQFSWLAEQGWFQPGPPVGDARTKTVFAQWEWGIPHTHTLHLLPLCAPLCPPLHCTAEWKFWPLRHLSAAPTKTTQQTHQQRKVSESSKTSLINSDPDKLSPNFLHGEQSAEQKIPDGCRTKKLTFHENRSQ